MTTRIRPTHRPLATLALSLLALAPACPAGPDNLCGTKTNLDPDGKLLARYQPETPGAGYLQVVKLAVDFLKTCPPDPANGLPIYLTHCSILPNRDGGFRGSDWVHNPAVVNGGLVQSLALDWRVYSGDTAGIELARQALDHHLQFGTTPAGWDWERVPYASSDPGKTTYQGAARYDKTKSPKHIGRGDGSFTIEADKVGELGMGYLRFYQISGGEKYLEAAINCADALAKHVRKGPHDGRELNMNNLALVSPWPFRVRAEKGEVVEEYTSHVVENLRLLEELVRIKDRIRLAPEKAQAYQKCADAVWQWLYAPDGPIKTSIWKGYFEDMPLDPSNLNRVNNSPLEFARHLIKHPDRDPRIATTVPALVWWVKNTFGEPGMDGINEQTTCYKPMGSHSARYASICALWFERTGDPWFKDEAFRHFNFATYMAHPNGFVQVGPTWGAEVWISDGYTDYIRHFMEGLAAIPEWAPGNENHLLRSSSVVRKIDYSDARISFETFDDTTSAVLRLATKPVSVSAGGKALTPAADGQPGTYAWQPRAQGGVLRFTSNSGNPLVVQLK